MKKLLIISLALLATIVAACDVHELPVGDSDVAVTLNLKFKTDLPQYQTMDFSTRAGSLEYQTRYVINMYKYASESYSSVPSYTFVFVDDNTSVLDNTFTFGAEAANYRVVVWTDYVEKGTTAANLFYDPTNFSEVTLTKTYYGAEPMRDCYFGSENMFMADLLASGSSFECTVNLERPVARFNFVSTDEDKFLDYWIQQLALRNGTYVKMDKRDLDINKFTVRFVYPQYLPNTFNLHTGKAVDSATGVSFTTNMFKMEDGNIDLGFDWVFMGDEGKVVVSLELYDQDNTYISTVSNITVPVKRGQQTTVVGNILTSGISSGISIDPTYDGEFTVFI